MSGIRGYTEQEDDDQRTRATTSTAIMSGYPGTSCMTSFDAEKFRSRCSTTTTKPTEEMIGSTILDDDISLDSEEFKQILDSIETASDQELEYATYIKKCPNSLPVQRMTKTPNEHDNTLSSEKKEHRKPFMPWLRKKWEKAGNMDRARNDSENTYPHTSNNTGASAHGFKGPWTEIPSTFYTDSDDQISDSILDEEWTGPNRCLEHDIIATKYGLPYDTIECSCHSKNDNNAKCVKEPAIEESTSSICSSGSCYNFEEVYGKIDDIALRVWNKTKRYRTFKQASKVLDIYIGTPGKTLEKAFLEADYTLKIFYPHYWAHLSKKYVLFLRSKDYERERHSKKAVVQSCKRILREQAIFSQHYQVQMKDSGKYVQFTGFHLNKDFQMACEFLKKEYPSLFQYLMVHYHFPKYVIKRMTIDNNRLRMVEKVNQSDRILSKNEEKYMLLTTEKATKSKPY